MNQNRRHFFGLLVGCLAITLLPLAGYSQQPPLTAEQQKIAQLFDKWNDSLKTQKAEEVVKNYASKAILLPTLKNDVRHDHKEIANYFEHFLPDKPVGKI